MDVGSHQECPDTHHYLLHTKWLREGSNTGCPKIRSHIKLNLGKTAPVEGDCGGRFQQTDRSGIPDMPEIWTERNNIKRDTHT